MSTVGLTGSDVIVIQERLLTDLADGDCVALTHPDDIATVTVGKNNNAIYGLNESGNRAEVVLRIIRGSGDDKFLNNLLTQQKANFAGFVLMTGEFIKKVGTGQGKISNDTYILSGGIFTKRVEGKNNTSGEAEQSVAIYTINFARAERAIG